MARRPGAGPASRRADERHQQPSDRGLAASVVAARAPDLAGRRGFVARVLPGLRDFVAWWRDSRTLPGSPLPVMVHPWESGWDNSPRWDVLAKAGLKPSRPYQRLDTVHVGAAQRPTGKDYDSFLALAELLNACDYDVRRYRERSPFCVHDVLVDALWHRAAVEVNQLAGEVGEKAAFAEAELDEFAAAFESTHWDEQARAYVDYDLVGGRRLAAATAAGVAALAGGVARAERATSAWRSFSAAAEGLTPVPTASGDRGSNPTATGVARPGSTSTGWSRTASAGPAWPPRPRR